jgi:osmotically-inducible protein OsmY
MLFSVSLMAMPSSQSGQQQPAPDNTKRNKGDADKDATTADQQKMNPADRDTTKKIRAAIIKDKSLSTYAHNVKIITQNGKVTLKGPVRSDDEKFNIEGKAAAVAGAGNVTSQLTVAPPKQY